MSLSTFLLGKKASKVIDKDLDALFQTHNSTNSNVAPVSPAPGASDRKRKLKEGGERKEKKRSKATKDEDETMDKPASPKKEKSTKSPKQKGHSKKVAKEVKESDEENSDLEKSYPSTSKQASQKGVDVDSDSDEEGDPSKLVHEALAKDGSSNKKGSTGSKAKYIPEDETPEQRDARTIFVGNLSVNVAQKKTLLKQFQRHIISHVPTAKIESTRFRSAAFQNPTSKLPGDDDDDSKSKSSKGRQHDRDRTTSWRSSKPDEDDFKTDEKKFLTPNQKKKIAFINHEFHPSADSVNAYVVFSHPLPAASRAPNVPPPAPVMDPYEAARLAVETCNGTIFMDRMIRVDFASKTAAQVAVASAAAISGAMVGDPKLSVFVGNLDFASKEEDLRVFFEGIVSAERGAPDGETDVGEKLKSWVTRVRIVRDKDTQLGKGFAYVQFADRECVDEVLALEEGKLKFAKRKLRVQRCKTVPGKTLSSSKTSSAKAASASASHSTSVPIIPKGDPSLGAKLAHLSKEDRKKAKSSDSDRLARRMAKKKARNVLAKQGVKVQVKDRERVRKSGPAKTIRAPKKESKGRARSDKSIAKRNLKK
ncbi:hypothetical protein SERLA73DRAFT_171723 [Serpula lacrymans var. lacrymans S7.3]|uniref:Nucleolar protein 12 n=2 Tax=Serpula lacrymans var. lacrymans TaxID=341189 RepID=F8QCF5_SERL3|nr:uncharacterized protein SERLADRAFT_364031 [Serpula lacrymans var. lacrymans S7.9]EGN93820.1 hypothetical protein SERLA73DRAFT_171723 [Serpula lacrymans var. lacrymans S7.3]EGO19188.1 hypothetical protein SERLADRAFT_364031 [Serpula lacrymans var. lacrymans S7.9]